VRVPAPCYQVSQLLAAVFPHLRPAECRGLTLWVVGTILAGSACQTAVISALRPLGLGTDALRQRLREWTYDGADRAAPCATRLEVERCFAPLLGWVVRLWQGETLPLAIDMTSLGTRWVVVAICVLYRGTAIPIAWQMRPGPGYGPWMPTICALLRTVQPAVPPAVRVLVLTDRGLWSSALWRQIRALGWTPVMRIRPDATFAPQGRPRRLATSLVGGPGHAWIGAGTAFKHTHVRRQGTLVVVWETGQAEPWLVLTDLPPDQIGLAWYGLRIWVEQGFRALKSAGWHWERIRRTDPERVARHWLVLAVASVLTATYGTRIEDADWAGIAPRHFHHPRDWPPERHTARVVHLLTTGRDWLRWLLARRRWWTRLWLLPAPLPSPPPTLRIHRDQPPEASP
jgi:hypothetical protein